MLKSLLASHLGIVVCHEGVGRVEFFLTLLALLGAHVFLFASAQLPAVALPSEMHVRLFESHSDLKHLKLIGPAQVVSPVYISLEKGVYEITAKPDGRVGITYGAKPVIVSRLITLDANSPIQLETESKRRKYSGRIKISCTYSDAIPGLSGVALPSSRNSSPSINPNAQFAAGRRAGASSRGPRLDIVNIVDTRTYVESVVGSEIQPHWPQEAIKAMAVLIQTSLARDQNRAFIGDSTQRHVYFGNDYITGDVKDAVNAVWGKRLEYKNHPVEVFYHPTCAGRTSRGVDIFGSPAAGMKYLASVPCTFCKNAPFWRATVTHVSTKEFETIFGALPPEVTSVDSAGRPVLVRLDKSAQVPAPLLLKEKDGARSSSSPEQFGHSSPHRGAKMMTGYQFWTLFGQKFGWDKAPGLKFSFKQGQPGGRVEVTSYGAGHGVGLCQWGAVRQADSGKSYREILKYYFPGSELRP